MQGNSSVSSSVSSSPKHIPLRRVVEDMLKRGVVASPPPTFMVGDVVEPRGEPTRRELLAELVVRGLRASEVGNHWLALLLADDWFRTVVQRYFASSSTRKPAVDFHTDGELLEELQTLVITGSLVSVRRPAALRYGRHGPPPPPPACSRLRRRLRKARTRLR
jgi:hypothetical protein